MLALNLQLKLITDHFSELVWKVKAQGHGTAWMGVVLGGGKGVRTLPVVSPRVPTSDMGRCFSCGQGRAELGAVSLGGLCAHGVLLLARPCPKAQSMQWSLSSLLMNEYDGD